MSRHSLVGVPVFLTPPVSLVSPAPRLSRPTTSVEGRVRDPRQGLPNFDPVLEVPRQTSPRPSHPPRIADDPSWPLLHKMSTPASYQKFVFVIRQTKVFLFGHLLRRSTGKRPREVRKVCVSFHGVTVLVPTGHGLLHPSSSPTGSRMEVTWKRLKDKGIEG